MLIDFASWKSAFMPFITEEMWALLPSWKGKKEFLMIEPWPKE
jgi:valyl-tRNA synthetase